MVDFKKIGQQLIEKKFPSTQPLWKLKKKYEGLQDLWGRLQKLVDPDTRDTAIFKESLKYALKEAGSLLEADLTKSPYYVLNQKGLDALFEAVTAMDTINDARKLIAGAETDLDKLTAKVADFQQTYGQLWWQYYRQIKLEYDSIGWTKYLQDINMDRFDGVSRAEAEDEVQTALDLASVALDHIRPTVDKIFATGFEAFSNHAALTAAGSSIVLAEKTADDKVSKLANSGSTVSHGFGSLEKARQQTERDLDALYNQNSGGKTLAERVNNLFDDSGPYLMRDWSDMLYKCQSGYVLQIGIPGGGGWTLPWDLPLPDK